MRRRIVYTRPNGGVSVYCPAREILRWMGCGGFIAPVRGTVSHHVDVEIGAGRQPDVARRFIHALAFGGSSTQEALAILRDRDCAPYGTGCELQHLDESPEDRWFREAWRRSPNGGPVYVHLPAARRIQLQRIKKAVAARNTERTAIGRKPIVPLWGEIGNAIRHACDEAELARVWPAEAGRR
jgi:hypothetical protein